MGKIKFTLIILLGLSACVNAQDLFVSSGSYIFVQDEILFVNDDIRLDEADSNIFLREDAQLIQSSNEKNSDLGTLSVYQNQTSSGGIATGIYEYNYWSSPVGFSEQGITKENKNFQILNLFKPVDPSTSSNTSSNVYSVTNSYNSTTTEIAKYWLWQMQSSGGYNGWQHVSNIGEVNPSNGFTMKGIPSSTANPNTIDFRGRPNTGDLTIDCNFTGTDSDPNSGLTTQVETLTGNPYPSTMDLKKFLIDPVNVAGLDGGVYFWEQKNVGSHYLADYEGGYAVYTPGDPLDMTDDGNYLPAVFSNYDLSGGQSGLTGDSSFDYTSQNSRRYAAIGQGFVVRSEGTGNGGGIIKNDMRLYVKDIGSGSTDVFAKVAQENNNDNNNEIIAMSHNGIDYQNIINNPSIIPEIRIHTKLNDSYYRENLIAFRQATNLSYNKFTDGRHPLVLATDTYFIADGYQLGIKSIEYDIDVKLPFGFNADKDSNTYSVTINSTKNISESIEVFVHDKFEDTYTDIRGGAFEITLPQGEYDNRFEVVFRDNSQILTDEIIDLENEVLKSFLVYQNNTNNQLVIKNPQSHIIKSFIMYDVTGKVIFNKQNLGNELEYSFPTNNLSAGTYITKVTTDQNFEITKKVIVNN
jgi:hypothetical protein